MNHARIAAEALRYRLMTLGIDESSPSVIDASAAATRAITCGDFEIDSALRQIASAWVAAGLAVESLDQPWVGPEIDALFQAKPHLVDALDALVQRVALQPS